MSITHHAHAAKQFVAALLLFANVPLFGATGTIFYNGSTDASPKTLRSISADGSNNREIPLSIPFPALPQVSRDGRSLLVTSGGPLASVMLSQNVFRIDLATGAIAPITHYVDTTLSWNCPILRLVSNWTLRRPPIF